MRLRLVPLLLLSTPAFAALPPLSASLGYASEVFTERSYDLVANQDSLAMFRLATSASFDLLPWQLDLELAYQSGSTAAAAHQAVQTELWLRGLELGATARYPLWRHLHPYVHLGGGWDWATLWVGGERGMTQTVGNVSGSALVGVQVPLPLGPSGRRVPVLVFDAGAGYVVRPGYRFDALTREPSGDEPLGQAPVSLGKLPLSGWSFRLLVSLRL